jgi:hypothetical protein
MMMTLRHASEDIPVTKLNDNVCAQVERAAQLLRWVAASKQTGSKVPIVGLPKHPDVQEFVDTAASLEALIRRSRRT